MDPRAQERTAQAMGGAQRADGGHGWAGDDLLLPEWELFAELVALVAEGV